MRATSIVFLVVGCLGLAVAGAAHRPASAQVPQRVDFARDVQPILRQSCVGCHGPTQQMIGLRLDRRRDAMRGSTFGTVIGPGNAAASRLYRRISGTTDGSQMPPAGALPAEQVAVIKNWIDQGAEWPDALSGDVAPAPADPGAALLLSSLRAGDSSAFRRALRSAPAAANRQGAGGITPLMYASLFGTVPEMEALLAAGADPNIRNEAGATALMWAADDPAKTRLLIARGADVNAHSIDGRTPLMLAAARFGSSPVLRLLLDKGADPNAALLGLTALTEAAYSADPEAMRLLIARGADPKKGITITVGSAAAADCRTCLELLLPSLEPAQLARAVFRLVPPSDDGNELALFLARGVDVNAADDEGRSLSMLAAASDSLPDAIRKALPPAPAAAVPAATSGAAALLPVPAHSPREAVVRALPILQQTGVTFRRKSGCVSCHNNTLTARVTAEARRAGIAVDETVARNEVSGIAQFIETWRERALQGLGIPGDADTVSYIMLGLADERHPADPATDAMARFLKDRQLADGSWRTVAHRPPIESSDMMVTALSMRALRNYAPPRLRAKYDTAVRAGGRWLAGQAPVTNEDRAGQLLGLAWAGAGRDRIRTASRALVAEQRADGGWAQLPTLGSDAYATGLTLVALHDGGGLATSDEAYQRGVAYLLGSQHADGTWHVPSRALAIQPLFDIGFPHGRDSWISGAASNWATIALAMAAASPSP